MLLKYFIRVCLFFSLFLFSTNAFSNRLLDMAQNGPRIIKLFSTVLDCRGFVYRSSWELSPGEKLMHVYVIDLDRNEMTDWYQQIKTRQSWDHFDYELRGYSKSNVIRKIYDVNEEYDYRSYTYTNFTDERGDDFMIRKHDDGYSPLFDLTNNVTAEPKGPSWRQYEYLDARSYRYVCRYI